MPVQTAAEEETAAEPTAACEVGETRPAAPSAVFAVDTDSTDAAVVKVPSVDRMCFGISVAVVQDRAAVVALVE